jgi:hypothetical protein
MCVDKGIEGYLFLPAYRVSIDTEFSGLSRK